MLLKDILPYYNEKTFLRKPNAEVVEEYAEKMRNGAKFPPIILGEFPESNEYGSKCIVDGTTRFLATRAAKIASIECTITQYETAAEALFDMYKHNAEHGQQVSQGDRNKRIILLGHSGFTAKQLARAFSLTEMSIGRIIKGQQGEGKSGPKKGAAQKGKNSPVGPKEFLKMLLKMRATLNDKKAFRSISNILAEGGDPGKQLTEVVDNVCHLLSTLT